MMEVVVTTGAMRRTNLRSKCHHQQTNTQFFYRLDALPVAQPTVLEHWRENFAKKALGETQTLRAGCNKAKTKFFYPSVRKTFDTTRPIHTLRYLTHQTSVHTRLWVWYQAVS